MQGLHSLDAVWISYIDDIIFNISGPGPDSLDDVLR